MGFPKLGSNCGTPNIRCRYTTYAHKGVHNFENNPNLGGQGDLVSRLIMGINGVTIWVIGVTNLLTKSP